MAPMCTPEKAKGSVVESLPTNNIEEMYFIPHGAPDDIEESITDRSDLDNSDDDEEVKQKMDNLLSNFPELDKHFDLNGQVGEGTFSTVYVAALKNDSQNRRFAVKHVVPTCHPERIKFELNCLQQIGGADNVAGINLCLRNQNNVVFVMPYQQHDYFGDYVGDMDAQETKLYMFNLLTAIARVHDYGIIHRDIKPSNFLYDRLNKKFLLVDFGLAQKEPSTDAKDQSKSAKCVAPGKRKRESENSPLAASQQPRVKVTYIHFDSTPEMKAATQRAARLARTESCACYGRPNVCSICMLNPSMQASRAGTPGFRPPEVLFKHSHQTTAVDMWATGVVLLSILSNCGNFFSCPNDLAALLELVTLFGDESIGRIANKFGRYFVCSERRPALDLRKVCCTCRSRGAIDGLLAGESCAKCRQPRRACLCKNVPLDKAIADAFPRQAYDLLRRLLDLNPDTRVTARAALRHPFFRH